MRITILMAGLLALGCGAAKAQDCHLKQYDSIAFTRSPQGLMLPVTIDNSARDLAFALGDARSMLSAATAKDLGLHTTGVSQTQEIHHAGFPVEFIAHASRVKVGSDTLQGMSFLVLPARETGGPAGTIGTLPFAHNDLELDMADGRLNLFSSDHCQGKAVYWTTTGYATLPFQSDNEGYIRVQMQLDGKLLTLGLTTDDRSVISMHAAGQLFGLGTSSPGVTLAFTGEDGVPYYRYAFQTLATNGLAIGHPDILIRDDAGHGNCITGARLSINMETVTADPMVYDAKKEITCHAGVDGALGLSVLARLRLYMSRKENLLYLTGAAAK